MDSTRQLSPSEKFGIALANGLRPGLERLARMQVGDLLCKGCGHTDRPEAFAHGKGREHGQHPDHRYCPSCGQSIDWVGYRTKVA